MLKVSNYLVAVIFTCCVVCRTSLTQAETCTVPGIEDGRCVSIFRCRTALETLSRIHKGERNLTDGLKALRCGVINNAEVNICCSYESSLNQTGLDLLNAGFCGDAYSDRIVNGIETQPGEFPWMALLGYYRGAKIVFRCAGSLISKRYVLTAAHCIDREENTLRIVRLGEHDTNTEEDCVRRGHLTRCTRSIDYPVELLIKHPLFRHDHLSSDIGLIRLAEDVKFQKHIQPICLPSTETSARLADVQHFIISGWGGTETARSSNVLLKANVAKQTLDDCRQFFPKVEIVDNQVCAGNQNQQDSCKGDSGGPLFSANRFSQYVIRYIQYGIVSAGSQTCSRDRPYPALYTNVMQYMPWITSNIY